MVRALVLCLVVSLAGLAGRADAAPADDRAVQVERLSSQRTRLDGERRALEQQLAAKTAEIAELKRQRASWSRDRKLAERLREAKDLASRLDAKAAELRALDGRLGQARRELRGEALRELGQAPAPARRAQLEKWRQAADAGRGARRVEIADPDMDPLDDPEDLDEKAGTLAESEARLRAEATRLDRRAAGYRRQARLAAAHARDGEDVFDDAPRRPGGSAAAAGDRDENGGAFGGSGGEPTTGSEAPPADDQGVGGLGEVRGDENPAAVYADVVDAQTVTELDRAERSGDPERRAVAAERGVRDLKARADQLRAKRLAMQRRAAVLRAGGE